MKEDKTQFNSPKSEMRDNLTRVDSSEEKVFKDLHSVLKDFLQLFNKSVENPTAKVRVEGTGLKPQVMGDAEQIKFGEKSFEQLEKMGSDLTRLSKISIQNLETFEKTQTSVQDRLKKWADSISQADKEFKESVEFVKFKSLITNITDESDDSKSKEEFKQRQESALQLSETTYNLIEYVKDNEKLLEKAKGSQQLNRFLKGLQGQAERKFAVDGINLTLKELEEKKKYESMKVGLMRDYAKDKKEPGFFLTNSWMKQVPFVGNLAGSTQSLFKKTREDLNKYVEKILNENLKVKYESFLATEGWGHKEAEEGLKEWVESIYKHGEKNYSKMFGDNLQTTVEIGMTSLVTTLFNTLKDSINRVFDYSVQYIQKVGGSFSRDMYIDKLTNIKTEDPTLSYSTIVETLTGIQDQLKMPSMLKDNETVSFLARLKQSFNLSSETLSNLVLLQNKNNNNDTRQIFYDISRNLWDTNKKYLGSTEKMLVNMGQVFNQIGSMSYEMRDMFKGSSEALAKTVYYLSLSGRSMQQLETDMHKFLDFNSIIQNSMEASAMTGRNFDNSDLMAAALLRSPEEFSEMQLKKVIKLYEQYKDHTYLQQQAVFKAVGLSVNEAKQMAVTADNTLKKAKSLDMTKEEYMSMLERNQKTNETFSTTVKNLKESILLGVQPGLTKIVASLHTLTLDLTKSLGKYGVGVLAAGAGAGILYKLDRHFRRGASAANPIYVRSWDSVGLGTGTGAKGWWGRSKSSQDGKGTVVQGGIWRQKTGGNSGKGWGARIRRGAGAGLRGLKGGWGHMLGTAASIGGFAMGGLGGAALTTGGMALEGFLMGGPLGAGIGALVGVATAGFNYYRKNEEEKKQKYREDVLRRHNEIRDSYLKEGFTNLGDRVAKLIEVTESININTGETAVAAVGIESSANKPQFPREYRQYEQRIG